MEKPIPHLVTTGSLPYMISIPESKGAESTESDTTGWPVLFFLHGYDEGAPNPIEQGVTRHGPLRLTSSAAAISEFIVVAPQLPERGDFWHGYADAVEDILQQVQNKYRADPSRTFLTGFSFGGNGVFDLAAKQPGLWKALWPVDPTRVPKHPLEQPIWLSSGQISRYSDDRFLQQLQLERLRPDHADKLIPGNRIYFDQGQDHVGTATLAYQDDRIYRWLLSQPQ